LRSIEVQGKSVDEAIFKGLDAMGLSIDEVDIEVIDEGGKRFLGMGNKQCLIRLTERTRAKAESAREVQQIRPEHKQPAEQKPQAQQRDRRPILENERIATKTEGPQFSRRRGKGRSAQDFGGKPSDREQRRPRNIDWGQPVDGGPEAAFLRGLFPLMGVACRVDCFCDEQCLYMRVSGNGMGVLIGRRGDTLNALQYLTSLIANRKDSPYKRIIVDTENYRRKREETLARLARRMADQVKRTGKPMVLEPMNPYERRVLHAALQDSPHVTTYSEGEEPRRHVIIALK